VNRSGTAWIDIKIDFMSLAHAVYWDRIIQPDIFASVASGAPNRPRADRYWSWTVIRQLFPLAQRIKQRRCRALTIFVRNAGGKAVPAGMMLFIERYPWPSFPSPSPALTRPAFESVFTWFISAAPTRTLVRLGVPDPPALGRTLVDAALVTSKALGLEGRMWLHAAPAGGSHLIDFYGRICGLQRFPVNFALPNRQVSDGRHFFAMNMLADQLLAALQGTR
jgi:hypothetical protein